MTRRDIVGARNLYEMLEIRERRVYYINTRYAVHSTMSTSCLLPPGFILFRDFISVRDIGAIKGNFHIRNFDTVIDFPIFYRRYPSTALEIQKSQVS